MLYQFSKDLLLRMPVKNPEDYIADDQTFLDDQHFRAALYLGSPVFFSTLERQHFQSGKLSEKEINTLRKYINRYCFRPTPFGLFAAVSLTRWDKADLPEASRQQLTAIIQANQGYQFLLGAELLDNELAACARFETNPSLYRILNEYRFLRTGLDQSGQKREYLLQSIAFSGLLKELITWCRQERALKDIVARIMRSASCTQNEAGEYAAFLIDAQLLVNRLQPHNNGSGYLEHLLRQSHFMASARSRKLGAFFEEMRIQTSPGYPVLRQLNDGLEELLPDHIPGNQSGLLNVTLYEGGKEPGPGMRFQQLIRDGIYALNALSPADHLPAMENFIMLFQQRFEGQTLPLLMALDPETGLGYQQDAAEKNNPLLETLYVPDKAKPGNGAAWTAAQSLLMKCWLRENSTPTPIINLLPEDLEELQVPSELPSLGLSVLFRAIDESIYLEAAGGSNATALLGRFTIVNEPIHESAKELALHLEQQNPHIIFAELLHLSDPHVDNVNRRKNLYHFDLPVTGGSDRPKSQQLNLTDLYVSVEQGKVVLFSKKFGKPVIPRLSSAYNHSKNKLPLFRFLADLPYQYGRFNLGLDLRQMFPDQGFYPRVIYGGAILSLATWIISSKELEDLLQDDHPSSISAFNQLCDKINLSSLFSFTEGDQELVFNRENDAEVLFFFGCTRQKKELVLKEFLPQKEIRQYNAFLLPAAPLAFPFPMNVKTFSSVKTQRQYLPGSEWLYLKIYTSRIGIGRLLLQLRPLIRRRYANGRISKWFFIRYEDHAPHIRLRMKVRPGDISEILVAFKTKLEDRIQQHVIREYQIDVYSRELERYDAAGMENTEDFFWVSSELILSYLQFNDHHSPDPIHIFALYTIRTVVGAFIPDPDEKLRFLITSYEQFLPEFSENKIKVELDKKYRELSGEIRTAMQTNDPALFSGSVRAGKRFSSVLNRLELAVKAEDKDKSDYLRSLIHMHLNRVFTDEPRKQEMIVYYLLYKYLLSEKGRARN